MKPTNKVTAGVLAGALVTIAVSIYEHFSGHTVDGQMSSSLQTVVAFAAGYFMPESGQ